MKHLLITSLIILAAIPDASRADSDIVVTGGSPSCFIFEADSTADLRAVRAKLARKFAELGFIRSGFPRFAPVRPGVTDELKEYSWLMLPETQNGEIYAYILVNDRRIISKVWWEASEGLAFTEPTEVRRLHREVTELAKTVLDWNKALPERNAVSPSIIESFEEVLEINRKEATERE